MRRRALLVAVLALAGCGEAERERPAPPRLPFPPRAQEPATSPRPTEKPAGRVVRVGARPEGVAVDPGSGLAALATADGVTLVDAASGAVRRRVPLPAPARHLSLAGPGGPFLVPLEDADQLAEVTPQGRVRLTRAGGHPHDATAAGDEIYVGDEFGGTLSVLRDGALRRQITVDVQPGGVAAVGDYVAVVSVRAYTLELIRRVGPRPAGRAERGLRAVARGRRPGRPAVRRRHPRRRHQRLRDAPAAALHRPRGARRARPTGSPSTTSADGCG